MSIAVRYAAKKRKLVRGLIRTYLRGHTEMYDHLTHWDSRVYALGVSDKRTVSRRKGLVATRCHYASVEAIILAHFANANVDLEPRHVLDIGSGAGHWIDFYLGLGCASVRAIEVSTTASEFLAKKYAASDRVEVFNADVSTFLAKDRRSVELISAIGVMFHIVDDDAWERMVRGLIAKLRPGGLLVIGGHFGWTPSVNVQFSKGNRVNKRLRSKRRWLRVLKDAGLTDVRIYKNYTYLLIDESMPENNVLIGVK